MPYSPEEISSAEKPKDYALEAAKSRNTLDNDEGFRFNEVASLMENDEGMSILTIRMWELAFCLGGYVAGVDAFFNMRFPTIHISVRWLQFFYLVSRCRCL